MDPDKIDCETAALVGFDNQPSRTSVRGTWRNFRAKYPAVDEMQARMLMVSRRLREVHGQAAADDRLVAARHELDLAQCGCAYWHGVYGGAYLPHLRQSVYRHLIAADGLIDAALGKTSPWVEATLDDWNSDVHKEVSLANEHVHAMFAPERGGMLYELDVREASVNLLATFARRSEPYHDVTRLASASGRKESLPDRSPQMIYDDHPRKSLIDHFFAATASLAEVVDGSAEEQGDFVQGRYHRRLRRHADRIELVLSRTGRVDGRKLSLTKTIVLAAGSSELEIRYELEGLPSRATHFGVEFNIATLGVATHDIDDRGELLCNERGVTIGDLGQELDLPPSNGLAIVSRQRGVEWKLRTSREAAFWTYPIRTLSRCQEGQEWIQQSIVIVPHWQVTADARGRWQVELTMAVSALTAATV
jgi:alpha-amylase